MSAGGADRRVRAGAAALALSRAVAAAERRLSPDLRARLLARLSRSRILTRWYHNAAGTFAREELTVLAGRALYARDEAEMGLPLYETRRATHRLEKGLCTPDRREVFGLSYVGDLVTGLEAIVARRAAAGDPLVDPTTSWSLDVLAEYFAVTPESVDTQAPRRRFERLLLTVGYVPGERPLRPDPMSGEPLTFEQLEGLVSARQSVRVFAPRPVERELLDKAFALALWSPSACNRLAYEFRAYDEPHAVDAIARLTSGMVGWAESAPCLIVITGRYRAYAHERDRHLIYVDAGLAAMTLQYALVTLGLASCCGNWPENEANEASLVKLLDLAADEKPVLAMAVGYPVGGQRVPASARPDLDSMRSYNRGVTPGAD